MWTSDTLIIVGALHDTSRGPDPLLVAMLVVRLLPFWAFPMEVLLAV